MHERVSRFSRRGNLDETEAVSAAMCPACHTAVESVSHFIFDCPKTANLRSTMLSVVGNLAAPKLQQCQAVSDVQRKVCSFVSCDFWGDVSGIVTPSIAYFLEKAWGVRNKCKHSRSNDSEAAPVGRGADGSIAMA